MSPMLFLFALLLAKNFQHVVAVESNPAAARALAHALSTAALALSARTPGITRGLFVMRGSCWSNARAGGLRYTILAPVLLSGNRKQSCSKSTCSQRRLTISPRRHPVNSNSLIAADG